MSTLLEAIVIGLDAYFGFGFPNGFPTGDSLTCYMSLQYVLKVIVLTSQQPENCRKNIKIRFFLAIRRC
jgi:hypothetical protein